MRLARRASRRDVGKVRRSVINNNLIIIFIADIGESSFYRCDVLLCTYLTIPDRHYTSYFLNHLKFVAVYGFSSTCDRQLGRTADRILSLLYSGL